MDRNVTVVEPPAPVVTLSEARRHLVDVPQEDEGYVEDLILAASVWLDGPTGWMGRTLGVQTLELSRSDFWTDADDDGIILPFEPVISITAIEYYSTPSSLVTIPAGDYALVRDVVRPVDGKSWPSTAGRAGAVKIRYRAGYGKPSTADPPAIVNNVPAPIRVAILMLVAQWYRTREPVVIGAAVDKLPFAVDALLQPYRVYR